MDQTNLRSIFRHLQNNPSTYVDLTTRYLQPTQDLTGQITKASSYYFAYGGHADIWEGKWSKRSGRTVKVLTHFFARRYFFSLNHQSYTQVAVKVIKGHHDSCKCKVWSYFQSQSTVRWLTISALNSNSSENLYTLSCLPILSAWWHYKLYRTATER